MKIIVFGGSGKMGQSIAEIAQDKNNKIELVGSVSRREAEGFPQTSSDKNIYDKWSADVVVDFSLPETLSEVIRFCTTKKLPLVSGTTGLSENHMKELQKASQVIPVLWAPNMCIGVSLMKKALQVFAHANMYEFQLSEEHHQFKKDSPGGTAKMLQAELSKIIQKPLPDVHVTRAGGIVGVHKVHAVSLEDEITIEHRAFDRKVFARGALSAARWLGKQKPGLYNIENIITN